jgi:hypothetical protein
MYVQTPNTKHVAAFFAAVFSYLNCFWVLRHCSCNGTEGIVKAFTTFMAPLFSREQAAETKYARLIKKSCSLLITLPQFELWGATFPFLAGFFSNCQGMHLPQSIWTKNLNFLTRHSIPLLRPRETLRHLLLIHCRKL